jgi:hypothetical protein
MVYYVNAKIERGPGLAERDVTLMVFQNLVDGSRSFSI